NRRRLLKMAAGAGGLSLVGSSLLMQAAMAASAGAKIQYSVVETNAGKLRGATVGGVHIFKGIPYGEPTGGANRFKPPVKRQPWSGVRDALAFGNNAPQASHAEAGGMAGVKDPAAAERMKA